VNDARLRIGAETTCPARPQAGHLWISRLDTLTSIAWFTIAVWLLGTFGAFWHFELRDWRTFSTPRMQSFDIDGRAQVERWFRTHVGLASGPAPARLTVVHLYNPDCRCNRYTEPHLRRLIDRYQSRGVRFVAALTPRAAGGAGSSPFGLPMFSSDSSLASTGVNLAPAALIFDNTGRLIFYGPYSDSAWCGGAGAKVEPVLDRGLLGLPPAAAITEVRGCFCAW